MKFELTNDDYALIREALQEYFDVCEDEYTQMKISDLEEKLFNQYDENIDNEIGKLDEM